MTLITETLGPLLCAGSILILLAFFWHFLTWRGQV